MEYGFTEKKISPQRSIIELGGRITAVNTEDIKKRIHESIAGGSIELIFDLSGLEFLDSSGLASFVSAMKSTRERGGWIKLAAVPETTAIIFKLTMLDRVLDLYPDVQSALNASDQLDI